MECHFKLLFLYRNNNILVFHVFNIYLNLNNAPRGLYVFIGYFQDQLFLSSFKSSCIQVWSPSWHSGKESTCQYKRHRRCGLDPWVEKLDPGLGRQIPWRRKWQPTPVFLLGKSHGQRSLAGSSPQDPKELDTTELLNMHI